jgi:hypothetical protein
MIARDILDYFANETGVDVCIQASDTSKRGHKPSASRATSAMPPSTPHHAKDLKDLAQEALQRRPCPLFEIVVTTEHNVKCRICERMIKTSSKDYNHEAHLMKVHDINWRDVKPEEQAEVVRSALRSSQTKLNFDGAA